MDVTSIAAAFVATQTSQLQTALAAKMLRMNADASAGAAKELLQAAEQGFRSLANVASGIGSSLDISV